MITHMGRALGAAFVYAVMALLGCVAGLIGGIGIAVDDPSIHLPLAAIALIPAPWIAWCALADLPEIQWTGFVPVGLVVAGWIGLSSDVDAAILTIPAYGIASLVTVGLIACRTQLRR